MVRLARGLALWRVGIFSVSPLLLNLSVLFVDDDAAALALRDLPRAFDGFLLGGKNGAGSLCSFATDSPAIGMRNNMVRLWFRHGVSP